MFKNWFLPPLFQLFLGKKWDEINQNYQEIPVSFLGIKKRTGKLNKKMMKLIEVYVENNEMNCYEIITNVVFHKKCTFR